MRFEPRPGVRNDEEFFGLMEEYFTPREWAAIRAGEEPDARAIGLEAGARTATTGLAPVSASLRSFYWHWVAKETAIKGMGLGLTVPLRRIEVRLRGGSAVPARLEYYGGVTRSGGGKRASDEPVSGPAASGVEVWVDGSRAAGWAFLPLLVSGDFPAMAAVAERGAAAEPLSDDSSSLWPTAASDVDEALRRASIGSSPGLEVVVAGVSVADLVAAGGSAASHWPLDKGHGL